MGKKDIIRQTPNMADIVKKERLPRCLLLRFSYFCISGQKQKRDPVATFDHSDIRGLVTA